MYKIITKRELAPGIKLMDIEAPLIAKKAQPGQFAILRISPKGERIPLTISDYDSQKGTVTVIFQEVGKTTKELGGMDEGDSILDFVGPLGNLSHLEGFKRVLLIGGGVGTAPLYPQARRLHEMGTIVEIIIGAKTSDLIILEDEMRSVCDRLYISTDDGSKDTKGFVTDVLKQLLEAGNRYDEVIAVGPAVMMKSVSQVTKEYGVKTVVSMNTIMIDGTGMCGGCRLTVDGKTKFACIDGPEFDGHEVDFDEVIRRQGMYKVEEKRALEVHECRLRGKIDGK